MGMMMSLLSFNQKRETTYTDIILHSWKSPQTDLLYHSNYTEQE